MTPQVITAIVACITLAIYITVNVAGAVIFIIKSLKEFKKEIMSDVEKRHVENTNRFEKIERVVFTVRQRNGGGHHVRR